MVWTWMRLLRRQKFSRVFLNELKHMQMSTNAKTTRYCSNEHGVLQTASYLTVNCAAKSPFKSGPGRLSWVVDPTPRYWRRIRTVDRGCFADPPKYRRTPPFELISDSWRPAKDRSSTPTPSVLTLYMQRLTKVDRRPPPWDTLARPHGILCHGVYCIKYTFS